VNSTPTYPHEMTFSHPAPLAETYVASLEIDECSASPEGPRAHLTLHPEGQPHLARMVASVQLVEDGGDFLGWEWGEGVPGLDHSRVETILCDILDVETRTLTVHLYGGGR